jgi:hypothetical protein
VHRLRFFLRLQPVTANLKMRAGAINRFKSWAAFVVVPVAVALVRRAAGIFGTPNPLAMGG